MLTATVAVTRMTRVLVPCAFIAFAQGAFAQNFIKWGEETFTVNLGGILNQFETTVQLHGQGVQGSDVDLESNGLKRSISSFQASTTWRFLSRNRIDLLYFQANRSGSEQLERTLIIGGETFPVGFDFSTELKSQFLIADYRFSFVKMEQIELAALLGFYGADVKYNASATGVVSNTTQTVSKSSSTTVPLPLIGLTLDWYVNPRWKISASVAGFSAHVGNVDGTALVAGASTEFMLGRNFGLGLAYMYTDLNANVDKSDFTGSLDLMTSSVSAYAQLSSESIFSVAADWRGLS